MSHFIRNIGKRLICDFLKKSWGKLGEIRGHEQPVIGWHALKNGFFKRNRMFRIYS
jgi:hypothetical protein